MSDAYGKGIVRGQSENTNLRAYASEADITFAESFSTCLTECFYGREYVDMVQRINDKKPIERKAYFGEVDVRNPHRKKVTFRDVATLYGHRPRHDAVWYLSPYEFVTYWQPIMLSYPLRIDDNENEAHHATLTESGREKLTRPSDEGTELIPGEDYVVKDSASSEWLPFPDVPSTAHFRHTWVLSRRRRPRAPSFAGAPMPRHSAGEGDKAALITMAYFRPWTLRAEERNKEVPYVGELREQGFTWQDALATWLDGGVGCEETKRYVGNFLSVHRMRPQNDEVDDAHSSDMASDEELEVSHADLQEALKTRIGGRAGEGKNDDAEADIDANGAMTHHESSSVGMGIAQNVWKAGPCGTHEPTFVRVGDVKVIMKEAHASQRKEKTLHASMKQATEREPVLREITTATSEDVKRELKKLKHEKDKKGKHILNSKQYEMVKIVGMRICAEMEAEAGTPGDAGEPLRWLLHGGPGTGKSHVIKIIKERLFQNVLKWDMGVNFQIVALQAVMADLLGGDTIHHACGIPAFKKRNECHGDDIGRHMDVAKKVLQWRWLIIDEISMVSAKLLAEVDVKLRSVIRDIGTQKVSHGRARPFGGLNVLCSGDFGS